LDSQTGESRIVEGCLKLSGDVFVASSLDKEIFDNESLFDFVHDWLITYRDDTTGRLTIIKTLHEYVFVFVLVL
jgi:hypothetical protein